MKKTEIKSSLLLLLTATIWGTAFVAQSMGMEYVDAFTFTFARSIIGGLVLIPYVWITHKKPIQITKAEWIGGLCCGLALCAAGNCTHPGIVFKEKGILPDLDLCRSFCDWTLSVMYDGRKFDIGLR